MITRFNIKDCRIYFKDDDNRAPLCATHNRKARLCSDEQVSIELVDRLVTTITSEFLSENKYNLTPEQRRRILDAMELESCEYGFNEEDRPWCFTHNEAANHSNSNGDPICTKVAQSEGCICCRGNRIYP